MGGGGPFLRPLSRFAGGLDAFFSLIAGPRSRGEGISAQVMGRVSVTSAAQNNSMVPLDPSTRFLPGVFPTFCDNVKTLKEIYSDVPQTKLENCVCVGGCGGVLYFLFGVCSLACVLCLLGQEEEHTYL